MATSKSIAKPFILVLICVLFVLAIVFAGLNLIPPKEIPVAPSRETSKSTGAVKLTTETDLHPPILHSDGWKEPVPLGDDVNTAGGEDSPFMLPDGNTLYFFFTPNVAVPAEKQLFDGVTGIYVSKKQNGTWSEAERVVLQEAGKLALDGAEFVQGDIMWFASAREGYTGVNLFTAENRGGKWINWQYVGDKLMKEYQVGEMHITSNGAELYFHSPRADGKGKLDIWVSQNLNGEWQDPKNIEAVNTQENEGWPFLSQDGTELWFTRTHMGTPAVYRSIKLNDVWQEPQLIISQFAGEPTLDNKGNLYFVHHFYNNASEMVEADIYVAYKK